jgi:hypothetical protein
MTTTAQRDLLVDHPVGREQDQPSTLDDAKRLRQRPGATLKLHTILVAELDPIAARPRHDSQFAAGPPTSFT